MQPTSSWFTRKPLRFLSFGIDDDVVRHGAFAAGVAGVVAGRTSNLVLPTAIRGIRLGMDMTTKDIIGLAILDLATQILITGDVPDAAI